jgi:hypothetical protein
MKAKSKVKDIKKASADPPMKAENPMECWSADLIGPFGKVIDGKRYNLSTPEGHIYCLMIVDNATRYCMADLLHKKSDATAAVIKHIRLKQNQLGIKLKRFHCDGGGEFNNKVLQDFFTEEGIELTTTVSDTSEHNGIIERMNRKHETNARCFMIQSGSPRELWGYAMQLSVLLHNHSVLKTIGNQIPIVLFHGNKPLRSISAFKLSELKVFGCDCIVHIPDKDRGKFDDRGADGIYLGYSRIKNAHRIFMLDTLKVQYERSVTFKEYSFRNLKESAKEIVKLSERLVGVSAPEDREWEVLRLCNERIVRGKREYYVQWKGFENPTWESAEKLLQDCPDIVANYLKEKNESSVSKSLQCNPHTRPRGGGVKVPHPPHATNSAHGLYIAALVIDQPMWEYACLSVIDYPIPNSYKDVLTHTHREKWEDAMTKELCSIEDNHTWEPAILPNGRKALSTRWVFTVKHNDQNEIQRWKARLVVKGYLQRYGIDYDETFAPTVHMKTIKYMMAMAAESDMEIMQIDFDTAFLHAALDEEIYIKMPKGYQCPPGFNALRLLKSLYGLKQAPREWYLSLTKALNALGYHASHLDECLFMKEVDGNRMYATVYVDDLLIFYPKSLTDVWESDKSKLSSAFKIKDIGECNWILNMRVFRDKKRRMITLSQDNYVDLLLADFPPPTDRMVKSPYKFRDLTVVKPGMDDTPLDSKEHSDYRSIVGQLLYLSIITRVDIAHVVGILTRFVNAPKRYHMEAVMRVLQYLYHFRSSNLTLRGNTQRASKDTRLPYNLNVWTDSDWADEAGDRKSISAYIVTLNNCPIVWKSIKQQTIALSSTEAEVYAITEGCREAVFLTQWLKHYFGVEQTIIVKGDNEGSHKYADHATNHERTKHYDLKSMFCRDLFRGGTLSLQKVPSEDNLADILTKAQTPARFSQLRQKVLI